MSKCPACDFPHSTVQALLGRIDNLELLVTLACDFADRVVGRSLRPTEARERLRAAREWESKPKEALRAADKALALMNTLEKDDLAEIAKGTTLRARATAAVAWATWAASWAIAARKSSEPEETIKEVQQVAGDVAEAAGWVAYDSERKWQLNHAEELACTCPRVPKIGLPGIRGRNSLLTG